MPKAMQLLNGSQALASGPHPQKLWYTASYDAFYTAGNTPYFNEPIYIQKWKILLLVHVWIRFLAVSIYVLNFNFWK